ncbi:hypothetical protein PoB_007054800 [Plakobranchus ocellatus]|uniref:ShKT domain-containing protein n=1 Tax=Plakobranchus ocellatus TaxID=259542 RepID=A0AAV4DIE8_9GAST|nr:hypothetical protein PoB_007054800 [Plakobranchus ocellatus]
MFCLITTCKVAVQGQLHPDDGGVTCFRCDDTNRHNFPMCLQHPIKCAAGQVCRVRYGHGTLGHVPHINCKSQQDCIASFHNHHLQCQEGGYQVDREICQQCCDSNECVSNLTNYLSLELISSKNLFCPGRCHVDDVQKCAHTGQVCNRVRFCKVRIDHADVITGSCVDDHLYPSCMKGLDTQRCPDNFTEDHDLCRSRLSLGMCPETCGICAAVGSNVCKDNSALCGTLKLAEPNFCDSENGLFECPTTCGKCDQLLESVILSVLNSTSPGNPESTVVAQGTTTPNPVDCSTIKAEDCVHVAPLCKTTFLGVVCPDQCQLCDEASTYGQLHPDDIGVTCYTCEDNDWANFPRCLQNPIKCDDGDVCMIRHGFGTDAHVPEIYCENPTVCKSDLDDHQIPCKGGGVRIDDDANIPSNRITGYCIDDHLYSRCQDDLNNNPCPVDYKNSSAYDGTNQYRCTHDCCTTNECLFPHFGIHMAHAVIPATIAPNTSSSGNNDGLWQKLHGSCEDTLNLELCQSLKKDHDLCRSRLSLSMCPETCGICAAVGSSVCADNNVLCPDMQNSDAGFCDTEEGLFECPTTCGKCDQLLESVIMSVLNGTFTGGSSPTVTATSGSPTAAPMDCSSIKPNDCVHVGPLCKTTFLGVVCPDQCDFCADGEGTSAL